MLTTTTSLSLLENLRAGGGERAWRDFFLRYGPLLIAFSRRLGLSDEDAQDAVQETLLTVHREFAALSEPFDRSKGRFKAWLLGIARYKVLDMLRRNHRRLAGQAAMASEVSDHRENLQEAEIERIFDLEWHRAQLGHCLKLVARDCDPAVYQAFELYAIHGQPPEQVAKLLGLSRNAVYISKTRVLKRIRSVLAQLRREEE